MGKYAAAVDDCLVLPAQISLTRGQERQIRLFGRSAPAATSVRLIVDTGSRRSTIIPSVIAHLNPIVRGSVRIETSLATGLTAFYWVRLEFPGAGLAAIPELAVAGLSVPSSLRAFHGVIGRDLLSRWQYLHYQGTRRRFAVRDSPHWFFQWLLR